MKMYFIEDDWIKMKGLNEMQEKYDFFLKIFDQGVKEYVPFYKGKEKEKKRSNGKCEGTKKKKE